VAGTAFGFDAGGRGGAAVPEAAIIVGQGGVARRFLPEVSFDQLGAEEIIIRTRSSQLLLAGGRPRGTLYAVSRFLQEQCGVRWWTPWASRIPRRSSLAAGDLNIRYAPPFESGDLPWTKVTLLNEGGLPPERFIASFAKEPINVPSADSAK